GRDFHWNQDVLGTPKAAFVAPYFDAEVILERTHNLADGYIESLELVAIDFDSELGLWRRGSVYANVGELGADTKPARQRFGEFADDVQLRPMDGQINRVHPQVEAFAVVRIAQRCLHAIDLPDCRANRQLDLHSARTVLIRHKPDEDARSLARRGE